MSSTKKQLTKENYQQMVDTILANYPYQQFNLEDVLLRIDGLKGQGIDFNNTLFWQMVDDAKDFYWMRLHPDPTPERVLNRLQENWKIQEMRHRNNSTAGNTIFGNSLDAEIKAVADDAASLMEWIAAGYATYESLIHPYREQIVNKLVTLSEHYRDTPEGQLLGAIAMVLELDMAANFMKSNEGFFRRALMAAKGEYYMEKEDLTYEEKEFFRKFTEISDDPDEEYPDVIG